MKQFSEATRVQMPAMVHLTRIGYTYFGKLSEDKNGTVYDGDTNILLQSYFRLACKPYGQRDQSENRRSSSRHLRKSSCLQ